MAEAREFVPDVPGSRSISARALVCAALADGTSTLTGLADCDDTTAMVGALRAFGVTIRTDGARTMVEPPPSLRQTSDVIDCAASGTTMRFITALTMLLDAPIRVTGTPRLMNRPMGGLHDALSSLGKRVDEDGPGLREISGSINLDAIVAVDASKSGQYVSALLMACAALRRPFTIRAMSPASTAFIHMTIDVIRAFGGTVFVDESEGDLLIALDSEGLNATDYSVEPDVMSANYFLAAATLTQSSVHVRGIDRDTPQGDIVMLDALADMGGDVAWLGDGVLVTGGDRGLAGITVDVTDMPDMALTLGALAAAAVGPTTLTGVGILRYKESDRLSVLQNELPKVGASTELSADGNTLMIRPADAIDEATIRTYDDHRVAMAFGILRTVQPLIRILDRQCVAKTWPTFFDELDRFERHLRHQA